MGEKQLHRQLYIVSYDTWDDCIDLSCREKKKNPLFVQSNYNFSNYIVDVTRIKMEISRVRHAFWYAILLIDFAKIDGFKCLPYVIIRNVELIKLVSF